MRLEVVAQTDVGMRRGHNEDSLVIVDDHKLYAVADGMGGHESGEVASAMAVQTVAAFFEETQGDEDITWPFRPDQGLNYHVGRFATAIKLANLRIHETAQRTGEKKGMGTTFVGIYFYRKDAIIAHVGDSRLYRLRNKELVQITEDHSLLNDYLRTRDLTPEEIENFPRKNVVLRALGMKDSVEVDVREDRYETGDIYLLCSDGLTDMLNDKEIEKILNKADKDLQKTADILIQKSNEAGGDDNITALLVRVLD